MSKVPRVMGVIFMFCVSGFVFSGTLTKIVYLPLIHKIYARLSYSSTNSLSMANKLVLINVVLSFLPIYFMSAFILSKWMVQEIDAIRRNSL
jgi:hypothetical protein